MSTRPDLLRKYTQIVESDYGDSADFTEEFYGAYQQLQKLSQLMNSEAMGNWMDITDSNYGTQCVEAYNQLTGALAQAMAAFNELEQQIDSAA